MNQYIFTVNDYKYTNKPKEVRCMAKNKHEARKRLHACDCRNVTYIGVNESFVPSNIY